MPEILEKIPFNRPCIMGREFEYIETAITEYNHLSGDGPYTKQCHALLEREIGVHKALLTTSCTHALEMSALLLQLQPGDEVIAPSFTFVSTVNAFALFGAKPVFVDVRPDTLNLDERLLEDAITPNTRAILPVHYAGVGCEMDTIMDIANRHGIAVVEDNAHALFAKYKGRNLGSFGTTATQSFHETKNVICGEGGALLINDEACAERAEIIREKGTNRSRFFRGQVDKYTWVDIGSSYLPSEMLAAFLYAQLEMRDTIQGIRKHIWEFYDENLRSWTMEHGVQTPHIPDYCEQSYHMYYLLMPSLAVRTRFIDYMKSNNIHCVFHYLPLNTSEKGQQYGGKVGDCPVTEAISDRLVRLPFYNNMTDAEQSRVVETMCAFDGW